MTWNLTAILVMLAVLFAGYGIGLLEMHLRRAKKIRQLENALLVPRDLPEPSPVSVSRPGLLNLSADGAGQQKLELDGVQLVSPAAVTAEQRRRLILLLNSLRPWVEAGGAALLTKPPASVGAKAALVPAGIVAPALPEPAPRSIVAQIDAVLQPRLVGTPLESRNIRLGETLGGGVVVFVGTDRYEGLDLVPDQQVVAAIRAAITEWEKAVK